MFSKTIFLALSAVVFPSLVHSAELAPVAELLAEIPQGGSGVIAALLRSPQGGEAARRELVARQGYCQSGSHACSDGGCCANSDYCGTFDGIKGCCPYGEFCSGSGGCTKSGYAKCSGESFCCPVGYYCYRDSAGNPKCSSSGSHTNTITYYTTTKATTHYTTTKKTTYTPDPTPTIKTTSTSETFISVPENTLSLSPIPSLTFNTDTTLPGFTPTPTLPSSSSTVSASGTLTLGSNSPLTSNNSGVISSGFNPATSAVFGLLMGLVVALG